MENEVRCDAEGVGNGGEGGMAEGEGKVGGVLAREGEAGGVDGGEDVDGEGE